MYCSMVYMKGPEWAKSVDLGVARVEKTEMGEWEVSINGYRVCFEGDENVLELDCVDSSTTLWMY